MNKLLPSITTDPYGPIYGWQCLMCGRGHSVRSIGQHRCICGTPVVLELPETPAPPDEELFDDDTN